MRTLLSQFCESFEEVVRPLLDPLQQSAEALLQADGQLPGREVRADLLDLRHQFEALVHKVSEQQAYVLLFGPLKSGKSTLMNAIAHEYVSEVSSLPAYPCMVFVSHGATRCFDVTRYSGRSERFTDPTALHLFINRAHAELAERIRAAEEQGEVFDPALHYPEAIRRVDVRLPAAELAESGAVLVDTPGLYARMRFGYGQMTRDFRDAASCAIFVVKSDNLFLEQVFEEFEDLLDLFSRIFLVVNLDSTKRDLAPDGRLVPSLEQEDPLRIIDAFESLAMSAPLKRAAEEGRLQLYPVDLLRAASARLAGDDAPEAQQGRVDFEAFQQDLTDYLNSTEYLVAFLGDSLRRATCLLGEAQELAQHAQVAEIEETTAQLEELRAEAGKRLTAAQRLQGVDWAQPFGDLAARIMPLLEERLQSRASAIDAQVQQLVEAWFRSTTSLQGLIQDELIPAFDQFQKDLAGQVTQLLRQEVLDGAAGVLLDTDLASDLAAAGVDVNAIGREVLDGMPTPVTARPGEFPFLASQLPVKRSLTDWLFLRTADRMRQHLFGHPGAPSFRIAPEVKQRRLGQEARASMLRLTGEYRSRFLRDCMRRFELNIVQAYGARAKEALMDALAKREAELSKDLEGARARVTVCRDVLLHIGAVAERARQATGSIEALSEEYGATEPEKLIQPVPAPEGVVPSIPAAGPLGSEPLAENTAPLAEDTAPVPVQTEATPELEEQPAD